MPNAMNESADAQSKPDPTPKPLHWGILGAARIARKAVAAAIQAGGGTIEAIGASSRERAESFAQDFKIPNAYEGYQAVLDNSEVEAVYLPLANGLHFRWALACARTGKHCLCEKPLVLSADEARQLREAFEKAGCRLVEGFMWRHHPQTAWIEQMLREGEIGELRRIRASFSFMLNRPDDFRWTDAQGGGALWDIGVYCVNAMRLFFGQEPVAVSARSHFMQTSGRTDRSTSGWLDFGNDRLATFDCSFVSAYEQSLTLVGTEGLLTVDRPFSGLGVAAKATIRSDDKSIEHPIAPNNAYEKMVAHFTRAARDPSFALQPAEDGLDQAFVMEALAESAAKDGEPQVITNY